MQNNQNLHRMNCLVDELEFKLIQYKENESRERETDNLYNQIATVSVEFSEESTISKFLKPLKMVKFEKFTKVFY
jgi:hypothetical protein